MSKLWGAVHLAGGSDWRRREYERAKQRIIDPAARLMLYFFQQQSLPLTDSAVYKWSGRQFTADRQRGI